MNEERNLGQIRCKNGEGPVWEKTGHGKKRKNGHSSDFGKIGSLLHGEILRNADRARHGASELGDSRHPAFSVSRHPGFKTPSVLASLRQPRMDRLERMGIWLRLSPLGFIFDSRRKGGCLASFGDAAGTATWTRLVLAEAFSSVSRCCHAKNSESSTSGVRPKLIRRGDRRHPPISC